MPTKSLTLLLLAAFGLAWAAAENPVPTAVLAVSPEPYGNATSISLASGYSFDTRRGEPVLPQGLIDTRTAGAGYFLVQMTGPASSAQRELLARAGAEVIDYVPNYTWLIHADRRVAAALADQPGVTFVGAWHPAYKLSPLIVSAPTDTFAVVVFDREDLAAVRGAVEAFGVTVVSQSSSKYLKVIEVETTPALLAKVATIDGVRWIEPWFPAVISNDQCQWVLQTNKQNTRRLWDLGIRGEGQTISVCDTGIRTTHDMYRDNAIPLNTWGDYPQHRKIIGYIQATTNATFGDEASNVYHGTHTAGSASGDDSPVGGTSAYDGIALKCKQYFIDCGSAAGLYLPYDLASLFSIPYGGNSGGQARVNSNSWGSKRNNTYSTQAQSADQLMWEKKDYLVCFANGNIDYGDDSLVCAPATAKSILSVGACNNGLNASMPVSWSCFGYTQDGRLKPTVLGPGILNSAYGAGDNAYISYMGTSMACPAAASAMLLARQYFVEGWYPSGAKTPASGFTPSAALLKAVAINSAVPKLAFYYAPEKHIGWGRVCLDSALFFTGDRRKLWLVDNSGGINEGQELQYQVTVSDNGLPFKVTLVWTDYPGNSSTITQIRNDLDLTVVDPAATQYKGNVYGATGESVTGGSADTLNVEECFRKVNPALGTWTIKVKGRSVPYSPQPFAVVVTGGISTGGPTIAVDHIVVDDAGQAQPNGRLDPGETAKLLVFLKNSGTDDATGTAAVLRESSTYLTVPDSTADYGTIAKSGGIASGEFRVTASASTPAGTAIPLTFHVTAGGGYSSDPTFTLTVGVALKDYADHNVGNCVLTVTKQGSIGYLTLEGAGSGFQYPKGSASWLFHGSFVLANSPSYVMDRFFPDNATGTNNLDWVCTTSPDGRVAIGDHVYSDQDSRAMYNDNGASAKKGAVVTQSGYAWQAAPDDNYVLLAFDVKNGGASAINGAYAGIIADYDMGMVPQNRGAVDAGRRLVYMRQASTENPCVGIKLLDPTTGNLSLLDNTKYVYNGANNVWTEQTLWQFMNGTLKFTTTDHDSDWTIVASAGPFDLAAGATKRVAFALLGASSLTALQSSADRAQTRYATLGGIAEDSPTPVPARWLTLSHPNPFRSLTRIEYTLPADQDVRLAVYDPTGVRVAVLAHGRVRAGHHALVWEGRDTSGRRLPTGVYFCRLETATRTETSKLVLVE